MIDEDIEFGDFDEDDALDDEVDWSEIDVESLIKLQEAVDQVNSIEDNERNRIAAKRLVRELNGGN